jgi:small-conductance mechanosensitive channel
MNLNNFQQEVTDFVGTFLEWIPVIIITILILIAGWIVAGIFGSLTKKLLKRAGLDRHINRNQFGERVNEALNGSSRFLGKVVFWLIILGTFSVAANYLQLDPVTDLVRAIYSYLPNVLEALVIFVVAVLAVGAARNVVLRMLGDTATGKVVNSVVPVVVLSIAGFMVLNALQIAPQIVNITYTALIGAVALGMALAFGLGGRDVAARLLEQAYTKGQETTTKAKADAKKGKRGRR